MALHSLSTTAPDSNVAVCTERPTIHDDDSVDLVRRFVQLDPHPLRRLRYAFYQLRHSEERALQELPRHVRFDFAGHIDFHPLTLEGQHPAGDGATKLVYRTRHGLRLESVILRGGGGKRTTLCVSSQVGCAANCCFCATGQMPRVRNLSAGEILDQLIQANQQLMSEGRRVRNVVFMGMGEPFHNEEEVVRAASLLFSRQHFNLSQKRTLLSTVGIPDAMVRWARKFRNSPIALSLHSARQEIRSRLIPLAHRYPLDVLQQAMDEVLARQDQPMMIEHLMLADINDSLDDADALADFAQGRHVLINLIPFNRVDHAPELERASASRITAFALRLRDRGFIVTIRHSLGSEVAAACGQLVQQRSE